jgi:hypothetical protein
MLNGEAIGFGPYNNDLQLTERERNFLDRMEWFHYMDLGETHPGLVEDFCDPRIIKKDILSYYFACPTLDSLLEWFLGFLDGLLEIGFTVVEYVVKEALVGLSGLQVVFREDDIISSKVIDLTQL